MRESHDLQDLLGDSRQHPQRLAGLQQRLVALDTWRHWAIGGEITMNATTQTASILNGANDPHLQALARTVIDITPELFAGPGTPGIEIERDGHSAEVELEIDL